MKHDAYCMGGPFHGARVVAEGNTFLMVEPLDPDQLPNFINLVNPQLDEPSRIKVHEYRINGWWQDEVREEALVWIHSSIPDGLAPIEMRRAFAKSCAEIDRLQGRQHELLKLVQLSLDREFSYVELRQTMNKLLELLKKEED